MTSGEISRGSHRGVPVAACPWLAGVVVALVVILGACGVAPRPATTPATGRLATSAITPSPLPSAAEAARELAALRTDTRVTPSSAGYVRSAFGTSWVDTDHNGCNQRDDVLLRDGVRGTVRVARQGACDHDVVAGSWIDPYTGQRLDFDNLKDSVQARGVQIDHVVPLAEAWVSGADEWTTARRKDFANDLAELIAVDGSANESKGDGDPAAWRPKKSYQCTYALRWISVKSTWMLAVDASERRALQDMLGTCS